MTRPQASHPLQSILSSPHPPPFIYLHHPYHSHKHVLPPAEDAPGDSSTGPLLVMLDAAAYSSAREVYTALVREAWRVISAADAGGAGLAGRKGWDGKDVVHLDGLVRGLRKVSGSAVADGTAGPGKDAVNGKGKDADRGVHQRIRPIVLVINRAEQLHRIVGNGWGVLSRLPEMIETAAGSAQPLAPLSVLLTSAVPWDAVRPATSDAVEPYHVYLDRPSKIDTLRALLASPSAESMRDSPLFPPFLVVLYGALAHLIPRDVVPEFERVLDCCWTVWVDSAPQRGAAEEGGPTSASHSLITALTRASAAAFLAASDLLTRRISPEAFVDAYVPSRVRARALEREGRQEGVGAFMSLAREVAGGAEVGGTTGTNGMPNPFLSPSTTPIKSIPAASTGATRPPRIPYYAKYLVLAAYFASFNPRTSDLRLFGRGPLAEPFKGRKKGGGMRRVGASGGLGARNIAGRVGKIPQRLLGLKSFPLERLLAIFQSLLAEHGFAHHHPASERGLANGSAFEAFALMSEDERDAARRRETERAVSWEEEVEALSRSVGIMGMIPELCEMSLLRLTSPAGRLDRILLRSETPREWAWAYATQVGVRDVARYLADQD